jgi:hypothetical protein
LSSVRSCVEDPVVAGREEDLGCRCRAAGSALGGDNQTCRACCSCRTGSEPRQAMTRPRVQTWGFWPCRRSANLQMLPAGSSWNPGHSWPGGCQGVHVYAVRSLNGSATRTEQRAHGRRCARSWRRLEGSQGGCGQRDHCRSRSWVAGIGSGRCSAGPRGHPVAPSSQSASMLTPAPP